MLLGLVTVVGEAQQSHAVQRGETLYSIAQRYNLSVQELLQSNDITDPTSVRIGTTLSLSQTGGGTFAYTVSKGDTYYSIARKHDTSVGDLLQANDRKSTTLLRIGEKIRVPGSAASVKTAAAASAGAAASGSAGSSKAASAGGTGSAGSGGSIRSRVATTNDGNSWPHAGQRSLVSGKFPAIIIKADAGDVVRSVTGGRVVYVGDNPVFGNVVFVQSGNGHVYIYGGQETILVDTGERLEIGSIIGRVGVPRTASESARLYFSVWHNNSFIDPRNAPRG